MADGKFVYQVQIDAAQAQAAAKQLRDVFQKEMTQALSGKNGGAGAMTQVAKEQAAAIKQLAVAAGVDDTVARLLRRWQRRGEVRKGDPALLMAQVFGGFVGVVRQQRATGRSLTARLGELTCEPAWNLLAAPSKGTSR